MADGAKATIFAGVIAIAGAVAGAAVTGYSQVQLAKQKFNSDLVLKALESGDANQRLETLQLLVDTKLLKDAEVQKAVDGYIKSKQKDPGSIPQVASANTLAPPIVPNARIYLLAATEKLKASFAAYKADFEAAGFRVISAKLLPKDDGRPDHPEVRYFYAQDSDQAEALARFMRSKLPDKTIEARLYGDATVGPGYMEVWLGR
jgi:hypothetical protein